MSCSDRRHGIKIQHDSLLPLKLFKFYLNCITNYYRARSLARIERQASDLDIGGSNPSGPTTETFKYLLYLQSEMSKLQKGKVLRAQPAGQGYRATINVGGKSMTGTTQYPLQENQSVDMSVSGTISRMYYITDKGRMYSFRSE